MPVCSFWAYRQPRPVVRERGSAELTGYDIGARTEKACLIDVRYYDGGNSRSFYAMFKQDNAKTQR